LSVACKLFLSSHFATSKLLSALYNAENYLYKPVHDSHANKPFCFSALPGGFGTVGNYFLAVGDNASWWSASEINSSNTSYWLMNYGHNYATGANYSGINKGYLYSVRCLQD
jgi:uncharacterized protein (TIGR02145 family)